MTPLGIHLRALLAFALIAASTLIDVAVADHSPAWILAGSSSASVEVTVPDGPFQYSPGDIHVTGGKAYAGIAVERLDSPGPVGLVIRLRDGSYVFHLVQLDAGRYRFTLITDGPARVEVPNYFTQDDVHLVLRPISVRLTLGSTPMPQGSAPAAVRLPAAIPSGNRAILVASAHGDGESASAAHVGRPYLCATAPTGNCPRGGIPAQSWKSVAGPVPVARETRDALIEVEGVHTQNTVLRLAAISIRGKA